MQHLSQESIWIADYSSLLNKTYTLHIVNGLLPFSVSPAMKISFQFWHHLQLSLNLTILDHLEQGLTDNLQ